MVCTSSAVSQPSRPAPSLLARRRPGRQRSVPAAAGAEARGGGGAGCRAGRILLHRHPADAARERVGGEALRRWSRSKKPWVAAWIQRARAASRFKAPSVAACAEDPRGPRGSARKRPATACASSPAGSAPTWRAVGRRCRFLPRRFRPPAWRSSRLAPSAALVDAAASRPSPWSARRVRAAIPARRRRSGGRSGCARTGSCARRRARGQPSGRRGRRRGRARARAGAPAQRAQHRGPARAGRAGAARAFPLAGSPATFPAPREAATAPRSRRPHRAEIRSPRRAARPRYAGGPTAMFNVARAWVPGRPRGTRAGELGRQLRQVAFVRRSRSRSAYCSGTDFAGHGPAARTPVGPGAPQVRQLGRDLAARAKRRRAVAWRPHAQRGALPGEGSRVGRAVGGSN